MSQIQRLFNGPRLREMIAEATRQPTDLVTALRDMGYTKCTRSHVGAWFGDARGYSKRPGPDTMAMILRVIGKWLGRKIKEDELLLPNVNGAVAAKPKRPAKK